MNSKCDRVSLKGRVPSGFVQLNDVFANRTRPYNIVRHAAHSGDFKDAIYCVELGMTSGHLYVDPEAAKAYVEKREAQRTAVPVHAHRNGESGSEQPMLFSDGTDMTKVVVELRRIGDLMQRLVEVWEPKQAPKATYRGQAVEPAAFVGQ